MLEEELTRIAALVTTPEGTSGGLRARPRNGVPTPGGDRLDELARWWSGPAGAGGAGGVGSRQLPQRVEHFWLPHTGAAGPVRSEVVLHRFTAPRDPEDALDWGVATADDAVDDGTDLLLLSIPVPEDEVAWQVAAAQVLGLDAVEAAGWPGPDLSDQAWIARVTRIRDGVKRVRGNRKDPYRLLHLLEHRELLAGTGLLLQAAARRTPAIIDGPVATTCALLAAQLAPASRSWWVAADSGRAGLVRRMLEEMRLTALTDLGLDDGDGVGARFALQVLETALLRNQDRDPEAGGGYVEEADAAELDGAAEAVQVAEVTDSVEVIRDAEAADGESGPVAFEPVLVDEAVEVAYGADVAGSVEVTRDVEAAEGESDSVVFEPVPVNDADFEIGDSGLDAERDPSSSELGAKAAAGGGTGRDSEPDVKIGPAGDTGVDPKADPDEEPDVDLGSLPGEDPVTGRRPDGRS